MEQAVVSVVSEGRTKDVRAAGSEQASLRKHATQVAAAALVGAGGVHFGVAPDHFAERPTHGLFFLLAGIWQCWAAALVLARHSAVHRYVAAAGNIALVALWIVSRTVGIPNTAGQWVAEPVGIADVWTVLIETAFVVLVFTPRQGRVPSRLVRIPSASVLIPAIMIVSVGVLFVPAAHH